jgi:predicted AlkP superfamily phosphohydrolase/phosphomutase
MREKSRFEYNSIGIWFSGGILFGLYVSFWLIFLNSLFRIPTDAGLITLYLLLSYTLIFLIIYFLIHFFLIGLNRLSIIKLTSVKIYTLHQIICLWLFLLFSTRFMYRVMFGYPIGTLKGICDLISFAVLSGISWYIIRQYNMLSRRIKKYIISIIYILSFGIGIGLTSFFWSKTQHKLLLPATSVLSQQKSNLKIMVIGIDGTDWKVLNLLVQQQKLPQFKHLMSTGVSGKLQTLHPTISPIIWTSIATGKLPYKHGVYSFVSVTIPGIQTPITYFNSLGLKWVCKIPLYLKLIQETPITSNSIHTSTIWEILGLNGKRVGVVGWWPSWPINPEKKEFVVADNIITHTFRPNSVYPVYLEETVKQFRVKAEQLNLQKIQRFISLDSSTFNQLQNMQSNVPYLFTSFKQYYTEDELYFHTGEYLYQKFHPDCFALYLSGIDRIQHRFWHIYEPEKFPNISPDLLKADTAKYNHIIEHYYGYFDELIGKLLKDAGPDTAIIILSDHGMEASGTLPEAGTHNYAPPGIIILSGPPFRKNYQIKHASVLDITPTILALAGLPVAKDMDGKILKEAFTPEFLARMHLDATIPSYDGIMKKSIGAIPTPSDAEIIEQLRALGYLQ